MKCCGCNRTLEVGDLYIEDTASGFMGKENPDESDTDADNLVAELLGGVGGKVFFCEDCTDTESDGRYRFETVYGDEDE